MEEHTPTPSEELMATTLDELATLVRNGACRHVEYSALEKVIEGFNSLLNIKVDYPTACRITGKSDIAMRSKISRTFIRKHKPLLFSLSDILKIRDKKI